MPSDSNGNSFIYSAVQIAAGTLLLEGALKQAPCLGVFDTYPVQRMCSAL